MTDEKRRPNGDVVVVTGKYTKDGKERNRYKNIGAAYMHEDKVDIYLDVMPISNRITVFRKKEALDTVAPVNEDDPINLNDIPF